MARHGQLWAAWLRAMVSQELDAGPLAGGSAGGTPLPVGRLVAAGELPAAWALAIPLRAFQVWGAAPALVVRRPAARSRSALRPMAEQVALARDRAGEASRPAAKPAPARAQ
jgi:hypothetical protein